MHARDAGHVLHGVADGRGDRQGRPPRIGVLRGDRARDVRNFGCGAVRADCPSISTVAIAQALALEAIPAISGNSIGRGRTSTSERAVMSSALWPASTSNAATRVPK
jgi:hypothetical protein